MTFEIFSKELAIKSHSLFSLLGNYKLIPRTNNKQTSFYWLTASLTNFTNSNMHRPPPMPNNPAEVGSDLDQILALH